MNQNWELDEKLCSLTREAANIRLAPDDYFYMIEKYHYPAEYDINNIGLVKYRCNNKILYSTKYECYYYKCNDGILVWFPNLHHFAETCIIQNVYKHEGYDKAKECLDEMKRIYSKEV